MIVRSIGAARAACAAAVLGLWIAGAASAQSEDAAVTLEDARERARSSSPTLQAAREVVAVARGEELQAGAFRNPALLYGHEQTSRGSKTNREDVVLVQQPFEIAGQRGLRRDAARLRREAAEAQLAAAELTVDFEVARAYALAVAAEGKVAQAAGAAQAFARAERITAERRAIGEVSGYDERRMALEAARYVALSAAARRERRTTWAVLVSGLGTAREVAEWPEPDLAGLPDPVYESEDPAKLREAALGRHPAIRAAELFGQAAEAEERLARREIVPDPVFGIGYKSVREASESGTFDGFVAEVSLPVPLWDRRRGAVQAAAAEARLGAADVRRVKRTVLLEVQRAWSELEGASEQLEAIRPHLGSNSEAAIVAASAAYSEGEIELLAWLDAVRAYYEVASAYEDLKADLFIRQAALERAVGGPLR